MFPSTEDQYCNAKNHYKWLDCVQNLRDRCVVAAEVVAMNNNNNKRGGLQQHRVVVRPVLDVAPPRQPPSQEDDDDDDDDDYGCSFLSASSFVVIGELTMIPLLQEFLDPQPERTTYDQATTATQKHQASETVNDVQPTTVEAKELFDDAWCKLWDPKPVDISTMIDEALQELLDPKPVKEVVSINKRKPVFCTSMVI